jgi:rod shape-determining protein MreC
MAKARAAGLLKARWPVALLGLAGFALLLLGRLAPGPTGSFRASVTDLAAPVLQLMAVPARHVASGIDGLAALGDLRRENERLSAENAVLLDWYREAERLRAENRALRDLTRLRPRPEAQMVSARVIVDPGGAFVDSLLIDAGAADGVAKGQAVLVGAGLVGQVVETGAHSARVLLITDLSSRVPVRLRESRATAVLAGRNDRRPALRYLPEGVEPAPGELVLTSGLGGLFPPDLPIARVTGRLGDEIRVEPLAGLSRLEAVMVVDYGLSGDVAAAEPAPAPAPAAAESTE